MKPNMNKRKFNVKRAALPLMVAGLTQTSGLALASPMQSNEYNQCVKTKMEWLFADFGTPAQKSRAKLEQELLSLVEDVDLWRAKDQDLVAYYSMGELKGVDRPVLNAILCELKLRGKSNASDPRKAKCGQSCALTVK